MPISNLCRYANNFNLNIHQQHYENLKAGRVNLYAEALELFMDIVFQLVVIVCKTASSECILCGQKRLNVEGDKLEL